MANINNFSLVGVGSSVKFGKGGVTVATSGNDLVLSPLSSGHAKIGSENIATETFVTSQGYLLSSTAASTYLTQSDAALTYQTQSGLDGAVTTLGYLKAVDIAGKADTSYVDSTFLKLSGGTMTGAINMGGSLTVYGLPTPSNSDEAATKGYVDTGLGTKVNTSDIGTTVQAYDADLAAIAALTGTAGILHTDGMGIWSVDTNTYLTTGTAASTYETISNVATGLGTKLNLSGGTLTGALVLASDPSSALQAATKQYVDGVAAGLTFKNSVMAATTANIALDGSVTAVDGYTIVDGDRILVKDQTDATENGIYVAHTSAAWVRSSDAASGATLHGGTFVFVQAGSAQHDNGYVVITNDPITVGTDAINWSQYSSTGTVSVTAGTGINVSSSGGAYNVSLANTAVTAGSYGDASHVATFTVDAQGRLTAAGTTAIAIDWSAITSGKPTTVSGYGITDAVTTATTFGGDVTGTYDNLSLISVGTPVSTAFVKFTTDANGRVTATTSVTSSDITTALGFTPVNTAGDTMSGDLAMGGHKVTGLGTPTASGDAATKGYVDGKVAGSMHSANIAISDTVTSGTLVASLPSGAMISRAVVKVATAFDNAALVTLTQNAVTIENGDGSDLTVTGTYVIEILDATTGAGDLTFAVSGTPSVGAATLYVEYTLA